VTGGEINATWRVANPPKKRVCAVDRYSPGLGVVGVHRRGKSDRCAQRGTPLTLPMPRHSTARHSAHNLRKQLCDLDLNEVADVVRQTLCVVTQCAPVALR
jgi:hypothetical protein